MPFTRDASMHLLPPCLGPTTISSEPASCSRSAWGTNFGTVAQRLAQHPQLRWLGPHKGVVHLALASLTNACFDLWAKTRGVPLWRLLLDLDAGKIVDLLDLSYLEDVMTRDEAETMLRNQMNSRPERQDIL